MGRFRKLPVEVDAVLWDGKGINEPAPDWLTTALLADPGPPGEMLSAGAIQAAPGGALFIGTLEGTVGASPGDYILRGVEGEIYPCKPSVFEKTYELVVEPTAPSAFRMGLPASRPLDTSRHAEA